MTQTSHTFQLKQKHPHFQIFSSVCIYELTVDPVAVPSISNVKEVLLLKPGSEENSGVKDCPHLCESDIQHVLMSQNEV